MLRNLPVSLAALIGLALVFSRNAALDLVWGFDFLAAVEGLFAVICLALVALVIARFPR